MPIRVVVAEDNYLVREGVTRLLESDPDIEVAGVVRGLRRPASPRSRPSTPDVVLTDIRMPPTGTDEGVRAAAQLRQSHPELGVVVLSQYVEPAYALELLDGGSERRAYLLKERVSDVDQLVRAIREVAARRVGDRPQGGRGAGRRPLPPGRLPARSSSPRARARCWPRWPRAGTTPRWRRALGLSERAVEKHINSVFSKLGLSEEPDVHRRVKAVLLYLADR